MRRACVASFTLHPLWGAVLQSYAKLETFDPSGVDNIFTSESHIRSAGSDLLPSRTLNTKGISNTPQGCEVFNSDTQAVPPPQRGGT